MLIYWLTQFIRLAHAEDSVDLSGLGMDDFTPYLVDRNPLWALAPIAMLIFVVIHLKKPKQEPIPNEHEGEKKNE